MAGETVGVGAVTRAAPVVAAAVTVSLDTLATTDRAMGMTLDFATGAAVSETLGAAGFWVAPSPAVVVDDDDTAAAGLVAATASAWDEPDVTVAGVDATDVAASAAGLAVAVVPLDEVGALPEPVAGSALAPVAVDAGCETVEAVCAPPLLLTVTPGAASVLDDVAPEVGLPPLVSVLGAPAADALDEGPSPDVALPDVVVDAVPDAVDADEPAEPVEPAEPLEDDEEDDSDDAPVVSAAAQP